MCQRKESKKLFKRDQIISNKILVLKFSLPYAAQKDVTSEIESQVAEFDAGAQQVEASAKTLQMAVSQNNVVAPYAKPLAPWC